MIYVILLTFLRILLTCYTIWFILGSGYFFLSFLGSKTKTDKKRNLKYLLNVWRLPFIKLKEITQ